MLLRVPISVLIICLVTLTTAAAREFTVGALYWSMNIPGQVAMRDGLEKELQEINRQAKKDDRPTVRLVARVAGDDNAGIERQVAQMRELIGAGVDLLIVQPTDNAALAKPLQEANIAGIPVVAYDQYISGGTLAAYRTSDNYQAGYLDGEYIAWKFPDDFSIRIILVEYPHVSSTVERVNGFLDALSKTGQKYQIMRTYIAVEPVSGKKAGKEILRDFPTAGSIDVVFTVNDGGGLAVVDALAAAGRKEIIVATIDGDPNSLVNIGQQRLTVIDSAQYCGPLGAAAMKAAYQILIGDTVPFHALVPVFPITRETMKQYSGWAGPIAEDFTKPWPSDTPFWTGKLKIVTTGP